jgi:TolB-like protein/DNA-binding winged helix-turn-helix (wHTH) protein
MRPASCRVFRFGPFEADVDAGELRRDGIRVSLQDQPFQVLIALLDRPGELVWRDDLRAQVWPQDTYVEFDHALNTAVKKIRIAIGDCATSPQYIETIPKRGYRFLAPVEVVDGPSPRTEDVRAVSRYRRWFATNPVTVALLVVVLLSAVLLGTRWRIAARDSAEKPTILAVLPLEDWSEDGSRTHLCEGITQELITQAGHIDPTRLAVAPQAASAAYRHTRKTVAEVARELRADYLLGGNLRGDARGVRVTVELIRVRDGARLWGENFDREAGNSLALETEIAAAITAKAKPALLTEAPSR